MKFITVLILAVCLLPLAGVQAANSRTLTDIRLNQDQVGGRAYHATYTVNKDGVITTQEVDLTPSQLLNSLTPELRPKFDQLEKERLTIGTDRVAKGETLDAKSDGGSSIANFIGWVLYYIASAFSAIVSFLISMMVTVAQYNNFLDHKIVKTGWQIVRDVCNNFFIIALLVIAVATILRQPGNYQYQQAMPKLLLMAVLINFSKVFTGIMIDASQVFTLFFASALNDQGRGIILYALGLYNYFDADTFLGSNLPDGVFGNWQIVLQLLLALILAVIASVVIVSIVGVLIYRIVTLWFLVILSPAAFLAYGIPGQSGRFNQWLGKLTKELIVAPVMLFFLYLSLFAGAVDPAAPQAAGGSSSNTLNASQNQLANPLSPVSGGNPIDLTQKNAAGESNAAVEPFGTVTNQLINFGLIVGLLVGSLMAGQQMGASGSKMAGAGFNKLDGWRKKGVGGLQSLGWGAAGKVGRTSLTAAGGTVTGAGKFMQLGNIPVLSALGRGTESVGKIGMNWSSDMRKKRTKAIIEKRRKQMEQLGMGEQTAAETQKLLEKAKAKTTGNVLAGAGIGGLTAAGIAATVGTGGLAAPLILGGAALGWGTTRIGRRMKKSAEDRQAAGNGGYWTTVMKNIGGSLEGFSTSTTLGAAEAINKENNDVKSLIKHGSKDPNWYRDSAMNFAYASSGQTGFQKKFFSQLNGEDPEQKKMRDEIKKAMDAANPSDDKEVDKLRAWAKGLAAHGKGGGDMSRLGDLTAAINAKVPAVGDADKLDTVDTYKDKVIASRNTGNGVLGEQRGKLRHEAFSTGKWDGMDIDFRELVDDEQIMDQLKKAGVDFHVNQEGLNIEGDELMTAVANKVNSLLDKDIAALQQKMEKGGALNQTDNRSLERLQATKARLADPTAIRSLQLQNSGLADYFKATPGEKRTTIAHERLHGAGLQDERSTEELAQHINEKNLHGATEQIGREAAALEKAGEEITIEKVLQAVRQKDGGNGTTMQRVDVALAKQRDDQKVNDQQKKKITESLPDSEELIQAVKSMPTSLADEISKAKLNGGSTSTLIQSSMVEGSPFKLLMKALTSINDNLKGANKGINALGADIQKVASGVSAQSTPLEIKVAGESIAEALTTVSEEQ